MQSYVHGYRLRDGLDKSGVELDLFQFAELITEECKNDVKKNLQNLYTEILLNPNQAEKVINIVDTWCEFSHEDDYATEEDCSIYYYHTFEQADLNNDFAKSLNAKIWIYRHNDNLFMRVEVSDIAANIVKYLDDRFERFDANFDDCSNPYNYVWDRILSGQPLIIEILSLKDFHEIDPIDDLPLGYSKEETENESAPVYLN